MKHSGLFLLLVLVLVGFLVWKQFGSVNYLAGDGGGNELGALNG